MLFGRRERKIRRILIVEDEPLVAFDNEHFLTEAGYQVVGAVDSLAEAIRVLDEEDVQLVLCDVKLRGDGDGLDVARAARSKGVHVLFVSGHCPIEARTLSLGCLAKPYTDKMLKTALDALEELLSGHPLKRVPPGLSLYQAQ